MATVMTQRNVQSADEMVLVHAAKAGDLAAFEQLVNCHTSRVFWVAMHILDSREDAEDVVQEAFLKAFQQLQRFEERARFSTWVTRIAINAALLRRQRARCALTSSIDQEIAPSITLGAAIPDWRPNPEQLYNGEELREILRQALASLPESYRIVFLLRDVEGVSVAETAQMLGLSVSNVKVRLFRARLKLREYLGQHFAISKIVIEPLQPPKQSTSADETCR